MISYRISCFTPTKPSTSNPRRSQAVIVRPSNIQFHQLSTDCIQRNNDRPTPILVQRHRPTIEHFSANRQPVDLQSLIGSQLHFMRSTPSAVQPPSARCKPVHYSKPVKISQPLQMPVWAPILTRKQITPFQTSRSKSILPKYSITPQYHQFSSEKKSSDVFRQNAVKDLVDQWNDQKCNRKNSLLTLASSVVIPAQYSSTNNQLQRHRFNIYLPSVVEDDQMD